MQIEYYTLQTMVYANLVSDHYSRRKEQFKKSLANEISLDIAGFYTSSCNQMFLLTISSIY